MKKLYKYIVLVIGILALFSCAEEELVCSFGESESDVTLQLGVQTQNIKEVLVSRAEQNMEDHENTLYDLHIYVFDAGGLLTGYEQIDFGDKGYIHQPETPISIPVRTKTGNSYIYALANINSGDTYHLSDTELLRVTDKNEATLNFNPNATNGSKFTPLIDDITLKTKVEAKRKEDNLNLLRKDDDFLKIEFIRVYSDEGQNYSPTPGDFRFMMSGYINQGGSVSIQRNADGIGYIDGDNDVIELYRILAKNTLNIQSTNTGTFTPTSYRLCNVPQSGVLVPNANINSTSTYLMNNITSATVESGYRLNTDETTITFYYPENLQVAKDEDEVMKTQELLNVLSDDKIEYKEYNNWVWKDRETNRWNPARTSKKFIYADDNAAYIEISGRYVSADGKTTADVTYTIHLGDFSATTGSISDFNVIRNSHYIYNVTVNGVKDIKVEAQRKISGGVPIDNPYAEGLIINATDGKHYEVDAHYEARVMAFKKSSIQTLKGRGKGYIFNISTPFGNTPQTLMVKHTTYNETEGDYICDLIGNPLAIINADGTFTKVSSDKIVFNNENLDYDWIKFVRNGAPQVDPKTGVDKSRTTNVIFGSASTHVCKYPGDKNRYSSVGKTGGWMNIFQLLAELYYTQDATDNPVDVYGDAGEVYYTCFIDENYYPKEQWENYVSWHDIHDEILGGKKSPRTMLIANNLDISKDGKSIYAEVEYSISQHPISTVYSDPDRIAFGTEIIDEEEIYNNRLGSDAVATGDYSELSHYEAEAMAVPTDDDVWDHNWDAYTCAYKTSVNYENKDWYSGSDVAFKQKIQPLYTSVAKACMSRNRDLNGDGTITPSENPEENEVRWYLAAVDQYRALVFGQLGLTPEAHLISEAELSNIQRKSDWGYGVNQNGHNDRGPLHYWTCSDEKSAATFWPEEGLTNNPTSRYTQGNWVSRAELVRCIRTLQSGEANNPKYGVVDPDKFYDFIDNVFTIDGIIVSRKHTGSSLVKHNERSETNDFSSSFEVATNNLKNGHNDVQHSLVDILTQTDYCLQYSQRDDKEDLGEWRTPNQKEMALMLSNISDLRSGGYGTRTEFSGYNRWHSVPGFRSLNGSLNLTTGNLKLRCVKDVKLPTDNQ